jgi:predicted DNA-binding protein with PD1-like motif
LGNSICNKDYARKTFLGRHQNPGTEVPSNWKENWIRPRVVVSPFASNRWGDKMRFKQVAESPKTFVVILDTGDEILSSLKSFARTKHLADSSFKAIGGLSNVELGWFNWETKKYQTAVKLQEQVELLSLIGDIALKDDEPQVHAHLVIGRQDGTAHGGHLLSATVRPTCEIVITESPQHLQKEIDPESGIALIRL